MSRSDIAKRYDVPISLIDKWEQQGLFPPPDHQHEKTHPIWNVPNILLWEKKNKELLAQSQCDVDALPKLQTTLSMHEQRTDSENAPQSKEQLDMRLLALEEQASTARNVDDAIQLLLQAGGEGRIIFENEQAVIEEILNDVLIFSLESLEDWRSKLGQIK